MPERLPSDHPSVETVEATLDRWGRTRSRLSLPADDRFPAGSVRLVIDDVTRHATIETTDDGGREVKGAYDNARLAREHDGEDRLEAWRRAVGLDHGRRIAVDIVESGFLYGIRKPGERAVYEAVESPNDSLASIARDLDG